MNRIFLAVLIVLIFSARATGQDPDTLLLQPEADPIGFDSIFLNRILFTKYTEAIRFRKSEPAYE